MIQIVFAVAPELLGDSLPDSGSIKRHRYAPLDSVGECLVRQNKIIPYIAALSSKHPEQGV